MAKNKKGQLGMGIAIILGVIALVILFIVGIPLIKSSIGSSGANLSGNDLVIGNATVTLAVVVGLAIVVGLIVMAFRGK